MLDIAEGEENETYSLLGITATMMHTTWWKNIQGTLNSTECFFLCMHNRESFTLTLATDLGSVLCVPEYFNAPYCTKTRQNIFHIYGRSLYVCCLYVFGLFWGRNGDTEVKNSLLPKDMGTLIMSGSKQVRP